MTVIYTTINPGQEKKQAAKIPEDGYMLLNFHTHAINLYRPHLSRGATYLSG